MVELLRNVLAKRVAGTSGRDTPATAVIGVGPQEIANGSLVRHFLDSVKLSDLVESVDGWRETTMETEDLALNNSGQRQVIE
jgi:hypothetical protein